MRLFITQQLLQELYYCQLHTVQQLLLLASSLIQYSVVVDDSTLASTTNTI